MPCPPDSAEGVRDCTFVVCLFDVMGTVTLQGMSRQCIGRAGNAQLKHRQARWRTVTESSSDPGLKSFGNGSEVAKPGRSERSRCSVMRMCAAPPSMAPFSSAAVVTRTTAPLVS